MSTATLPPNAAAKVPEPGVADRLIQQRIDEACKALWWAELIRDTLRTLIVALAAILAWVIVDQWLFSPGVGVRLLACTLLALWCGWRLVSRIVPLLSSSIRREYAARSLERDLPEMKQQLTSYVTLREVREQPGLRNRMVKSIGAHVAGRLRSHDVLPAEATGTFKWWIGAAAVLAMFVGYSVLSPKNTLASVGRLVAPLASIDSPKRVAITEVTPGDTNAIAGRTVAVSAKVDGLTDDELVWCRWASPTGQRESELKFNEAEFRYAGELNLDHAAAGEVAYYIEAGDAQAGPYWLSVQNVPVVALQSVHYQPPAYTGEVAHTSSSGAITAVDGTTITIRATTNRAIEKATIEFNPRLLGEKVRATAGTKSLEIDQQGTGLSISFPLRSARGRSAAVQLEGYRIRVWDSAEQTNPDPIVYPIRVIADLPPEVSIVMPRKTPKNLPLGGQQIIEVHAMDPDFGLKQVALKIRRGIDVIAEPSLWSDPAGAKGNRVTEYRFRPTEHGLRVGDVVKIEAVAIDNRLVPDDPSIEPNVSVTDAIELRIVENEPLPEQPDGNDGLSAADDRPASDDAGDQKSQSDANSDSTGKGDQQQTGGGQGGEGTSSTQTGDAGEGSETGQGSGQGDNNAKPQNGAGTGSDPEAADNKTGAGTGDSAGTEGSPGTKPTDPNDPDNKQPADGSPSGTGSDNAEGTDPQTGEPSTGQDPGDATADATNAQNQATEGSRQPTGNQDAGSETPPDGGPSDSASDAPPTHDAEAFERIRDYLEKQKQDQQAGQDSPPGAKPEQTPSQQGDSADQQGSKTDPGSTADKPSGTNDGKSPDQNEQPQQSAGGQTNEQTAGGQTNEQTAGDQASPQPGETKTPGETETGGKDPQDTGMPKDEGGGKQPNEGAPADPSTTDQESTGKQPADGETGDAGETGKPADSDQPGETTDPGETGEPGGKQDPDGKQDAGQSADPGDTDNGKSGETEGTEPQQGQPSDPSQSPADGKQGTGSEETGSEPGKQPGSDPGQESETGSRSGDPGDAGDSAAKGQDDQPGDKPPADPTGKAGQPPADGSPNNAPQNAGQQQPTAGDPSSSSSPPQGTPSQASGDGTSSGDAADQPAPAPPDLEYTKKATDMVLDYLQETRDKPDTELLKDLKWTEQDLQRFADRWQKVRDLEKSAPPDAQSRESVEEALRSLGMRPPSSDAALENVDQADAFRGIRDAGNRKPPPAAYRDVFEAFRRAVGRQ
jgi:hypothetical protein